MFNDLRGGINTRLYSKNKYDTTKNKFLNNRSVQDQNIAKREINDKFTNYNLFNEEFNKKYKKMEEEYIQLNSNDKYVKKKQDFSLNILDSTPIDTLTHSNISKNEKFKNKLVKKHKVKKNVFSSNLQNEKMKKSIKKQNLETINLKQKYNMLYKKYNNEKSQNTNYINNNMLKMKSLESKYNSLLNKYEHLEKNNINKNVIDNLKKQLEILKIKSYQEMSSNKEKNNIQNVINSIFKILKKKYPEIQKDIIKKYVKKHKLFDNRYTPSTIYQVVESIQQDYISNIRNLSNEKKVKKKEFTLTINSNERNIKKWPLSNKFQIQFDKNLENNEKKGYINNSLNNIIQIQLVSAIMPKKCVNGNNIEDFPFIILEIKEINNNLNTSNKSIFAQVTFDIDVGNFKKSVPRYNTEYLINFETPKNFNHLTFIIKTPDNKLYNFGNETKNTETDINKNGISLIFKITKKLENLNKNISI
jgi:hypothetical protein